MTEIILTFLMVTLIFGAGYVLGFRDAQAFATDKTDKTDLE